MKSGDFTHNSNLQILNQVDTQNFHPSILKRNREKNEKRVDSNHPITVAWFAPTVCIGAK